MSQSRISRDGCPPVFIPLQSPSVFGAIRKSNPGDGEKVIQKLIIQDLAPYAYLIIDSWEAGGARDRRGYTWILPYKWLQNGIIREMKIGLRRYVV